MRTEPDRVYFMLTPEPELRPVNPRANPPYFTDRAGRQYPVTYLSGA